MRRPDNEPLLFDLPLDRPAREDEAEPLIERQPPPDRRPARAPRPSPPPASADPAPAPPRASRPAGRPPRPAADLAPDPALAAPRLPLAAAHTANATAPPPTAGAGHGRADSAAAGAPVASGRVGLGRRLAGGAADLLVHVAVAVLALAGCRALGVAPAVQDAPAIATFLLSFSFLYTVVPLAFWGHTLGMTWAGLTAESDGGEPLSFDQTARRWLGALLTLAVLGLPLLIALTGRSLADRLSGSRTLAG